MKEFNAETGGRYTYADDLENLQDLSLAFLQIFDDCDNFVISGCEQTNSAIGEGYVYINGKIRKFNGATNITSWPQYIYERNTIESVMYETGDSKVGRYNYGCAIGSSVPVSLDQITGETPSFIVVESSGMRTMKDAFMGKYALLLDSASGSQTVKGSVAIQNTLTVHNIQTSGQIKFVNGGSVGQWNTTNSTMSIQFVGPSGKNYRIVFVDAEGFKFYAEGQLIATIGTEGISFDRPVSSPQGSFGALVLSENKLYQATGNETSTLFINSVGYEGGETQFRNTRIGNGKGNVIVDVDGPTSNVSLNGKTTITTNTVDGFVLKTTKAYTDNSLQNNLVWTDVNDHILSQIGFTSSSDQTLNWNNAVSDTKIVARNFVNICPAIRENGMLLSDKYVLKSDMNTSLGTKANSSDVYSKSESDEKYALLAGGLKQFVTEGITQAMCRNQIGAAGTSDLNSYAKLTNYLSDMATDDNAKKTIRNNLNVYSKQECQAKLTDTGWLLIQDQLYVKQVGSVVCIQGTTTSLQSGTVFRLPNTISAPTKKVVYSVALNNWRQWICQIEAGNRQCTVAYCDDTANQKVAFTLTYIV